MSEARLDVVDTQGFRLAFVALGPAYFAGRLQKLQVVKRSARRKSLRRNATIVAPRVRVILMRAKRAEDLLVVSHGARTRKGAPIIMPISGKTLLTAFLLSAAIGAFASHRLSASQGAKADMNHRHPMRESPAKTAPSTRVRDPRIRLA